MVTPGLRRPAQQHRTFPDPTIGITALRGGQVQACLEVLPCWRDHAGNICWGNAAAAEHVAQNRGEQLLGQQQVAAAATEGTSPELTETRGSAPCVPWQMLRVGEGPAGVEMEPLVLSVFIEQLN